MSRHIVILGVFVADATFRADQMPVMGETVLGNSFALGPGGKGSNQAVAAARAGGDTHFITKLGNDTFAELALQTWSEAGVKPAISQRNDGYTGAAFIYVDEKTGDNAIIVSPGIGKTLSPADIDQQHGLISTASVFVTQLEQPIDAALHALKIAKENGVTTILNPAPAHDLPTEIFPLCDYVTPNESEAKGLTGIDVTDLASAEDAARALLDFGVSAALITLGEDGALLGTQDQMLHIPAFQLGKVVETTGAGDAFNGGFAVALSEGKSAAEAVQFGCATAAISVTRSGAAASMPDRSDIDALLAKQT